MLTQYHPHSQQIPDIVSHDAYREKQAAAEHVAPTEEFLRTKPWLPFETRLNFELAELINDARLNRPQISRLFAIIEDIIARPEDLTIRSHTQLKKAWKVAEDTQTSVGAATYVSGSR